MTMLTQWLNKHQRLTFLKSSNANQPPSVLLQQAYYALGLILTKVISLFLLPYLAKQLGLIEFARLETLLAVINGATIVVGLGMVNLLYRQVGQAKNTQETQTIVARLCGNAITVALITLGGIALFTPVLHSFIQSIVSLSVVEMWMCTLLISIEALLGVSLAWLRMQEKAGLFFQVMLTRGVIYALLIVSGLLLGWGLTWVLFASVLAALYQVLHLMALQYKSSGIQFSSASFKNTCLYGWPFVISGLAMYATQGIEIVLLAQSITPELLAAYAIAIKLFLIAALLNQPFQLWWYPKRVRLINQSNGSVKTGIGATLGVLLAMITSVIVWLWSPWVIDILFHEDIGPAKSYLPWLLLAGVLKQWGALFNIGCFHTEKSQAQMYIELSTGAFCFIGFPIGIHLASVYSLESYPAIAFTEVHGVLSVFVLSQALRLIAYWSVSQRYFSVTYPIGLLCKGVFGIAGIILVGGLILEFTEHSLSILTFSIRGLISVALLALLFLLGRKSYVSIS